MTEAQFQTRFTKWLKNRYDGIGVFELKLCKGKRLPFAAFADHQIEALVHSSQPEGLAYKISDSGFGQKPFDCFKVAGIPAYVVIMFYKKNMSNYFYLIPIENWVNHMAKSEFKSINEEDALNLGKIYYFA